MSQVVKGFLLLGLVFVCVAQSVGQTANPANLSLDWAIYSISGSSTRIPIRLNSTGGERTVSFSIAWTRHAGMRYVRVDLGADAPADTVLTVDRRKAEAGRVGLTLTSATGFAAGSKVIARLIGQGRSDDVNVLPLRVNFVANPTPIRISNGDNIAVPIEIAGNSYEPWITDPGSLFWINDVSASAGTAVTVPIRLGRAFGGFQGMTNVSFSVQWDTQYLEYQGSRVGNRLPAGAVVKFDDSMITQGRLGVSITGSTPFVENYNPADLVLRVRPNAPRGLYGISFTGSPTPYTGSDANGQLTYPSWVAGFINTGLTYSWVDGFVTTPQMLRLRNAAVVLTDDLGFSETVTTGSFGTFRFESVPNLSNYTISVQSKRYRFAPVILQPTPGQMPLIELRGLE